MNKTQIGIISFALLAAFAAGLTVAISNGPSADVPDIPGLLWPQPPQIEDFQLQRAGGSKFTAQNLDGRWTLLFFGFTNCPDICPTTMNTLNQVYEALRGDAALFERLQVLFVSVDPERDDAVRLREYVDYFNKDFIAASAKDDELKAFSRQFGALFIRIDTAGAMEYTMDHSASILLVDPKRNFVGVFSQPHVASDIANNVRSISTYLDSLP